MQLLEKLWEGTSNAVNGVLGGLDRGLTVFFGSANQRQIKRYTELARQIGELEPKMMALSDDDLREQTVRFRQRLADGETLDDLLVEAFATCREAGRRYLKMRHYDVQLIGGMVLHGGNIAEMITGEGKTLVATLPTYLNALAGKGVHVVTVNDYLARRDMEWMAPLYMSLGLTVGNIQSGMSNSQRQQSYAADITYATNNELGFDYLRDNMRMAARGDKRFPDEQQQVQGPLYFAVIDEVDNILIDEARTPLIISGSAARDMGKYAEADKVARALVREEHFVVNEKDHTVNLTDNGIREAEKLAGVESFYTVGNMEWPHLLDNALKAHHLYKRDVNYVVKDGEIIIVDEFTGRLMEGRQWSDGLHQSVEAKEGVRIKEETQTLATITLQNFFKLYKKISGMTGTAMTEANEFSKIYNLGVIAVPSNRGLQRIEYADAIYLSEKEKYEAVAEEVERVHKYDTLRMTKGRAMVIGTIQSENDQHVVIKKSDSKELETIPLSEIETIERSGRPILVGTVSIEKSERLSSLLDKRGVQAEVLNAKQHKREADIVAQAGRMGAITIATNMAGRGTDIILGGNPETMAWAQLQHKYPTRLEVPKEEWDGLVHEIEQREQMKAQGEQVRQKGGLYVIGTERHESRRIDLQLRGRCGRQGDPGSSRFYLSLEDDLMRIFAGDWVREMMKRMGMREGEAIESPYVSKRISGAQKKVEERNFEQRKSLLEYDEVMDFQRKKVYGYRQEILDGTSCRDLVMTQLAEQIQNNVSQYCDNLFGAESYAKWAGARLNVQLEAKDFRGVDPSTAVLYAKEQAERAAETQILDAIDENLPQETDQSEWNWDAMTKWVNARFGTNFTISSLKKIDRDRMDEELIEKATQSIEAIDLSEGEGFLADDFGIKSLAGWMANKFGISVSIDELRGVDADKVAQKLLAKAEETYKDRESQFPILVAFRRFSRMTAADTFSIDAESLANWAASRFDDPNAKDALTEDANESFTNLAKIASNSVEKGLAVRKLLTAKASELYGRIETKSIQDIVARNQTELEQIAKWARETTGWTGEVESLRTWNKKEFLNRLMQTIDDKYFPEIRRMERTVLLTQLDSAWKDHLLAMDHIRAAVNFRSMGQMDPKVEYKREGMRMFEQMWFSIGERMTDVIFRMEAIDSDIVADSWVEGNAIHEDFDFRQSLQAEPSSLLAEKQRDLEQAERAGAAEPTVSTIRNRRGDRIGRNDNCPCGSGKKFKNCCMRKQV